MNSDLILLLVICAAVVGLVFVAIHKQGNPEEPIATSRDGSASSTEPIDDPIEPGAEGMYVPEAGEIAPSPPDDNR